MIGTLVRLRWTLTFSALKKSTWQKVSFIVGIVIGAIVVLSVIPMAWALGAGPQGFADLSGEAGAPMDDAAFRAWFEAVTLLVATLAIGVAALVQVMYIGESSTMSPGKFGMYGIRDRTLQAGLLASGLTGIPAVATLLALFAWSAAYRWLGAGGVIGMLVAAPLIVLVAMCTCKMFLSLSALLVKSQTGKNLFYIVSVVLIVALCQVPNLLVNTDAGAQFGSGLLGAAGPLRFLPWSCLAALPFRFADSRWGFALLAVAIAAAYCAACFAVSVWCLKRERLTAGADHVQAKARGIGMFARVADSPAGAVSGRQFTLLKRDARQAMVFVMPAFFLILFAFEGHMMDDAEAMSAMTWTGVVMSALFFGVTESNGLAYDGTGFTMEVIAGTRGIDDRRGRVSTMVTIVIASYAVLALAAFIVTGDWHTAWGWRFGLMMTGLGIGLACSGIGLAQLFSAVFMYPVPSIDKPFSSPQGRGVAQVFIPLFYILMMFVTMIPTGLVAVLFAVTGQWGALWPWIGVAALANGAAMVAIGVKAGGKSLDARRLDVLHNLEEFRTLQR